MTAIPRVARTRISRVKFKSGGEVHLLPTRETSNKNLIIDRVLDVIEIHERGDMALESFVFVVFDGQGNSTIDVKTSPLGLPRLVLAEYLRSRIIAEYALDWVAENYEPKA